MKKFDEFNNINENMTTDPLVFMPDMFRESEVKLFNRHLRRNNRKPFYINDDHELVELKLNSKGYPVKERETETRNEYGRPISKSYVQSLKNSENKFGRIYFMTEEDLEKSKPIAEKIKSLVELYNKQIGLTIELLGSTLIERNKKDEENKEV